MLEKYVEQIKTFDDFYRIIKGLTETQKGDLFEDFTECLFMFHPYYINFTKKIWFIKDCPSRIKTQLNIPDDDQGIDFVLLSQDDKYYAIQSKFRTDKSIKISWEELGTFVGLTFGIGNGFTGSFFVTNTFPINKNILNSGKIVPIHGDFFNEIPENFFILMKAYLNKKTMNNIVLKVNKPLDHQQKIIAESIKHFNDANNSRGYLEMACGSGKTLAAYWINKSMGNKLTIIGVPSLHLLTQFFKEWTFQAMAENEKQEFLLVGSDLDFDENDCRYNSNGLLRTTNSDEIKAKIKQIKSKGKNQIITIITTYQSSDRVISAMKDLKLTPEFCIFDEAHKTVGSKDKQFSLLLDDKNLNIKKRLFMTATPKVYTGENVDKILSMTDEKWYGKQIYLYNTYNAIKDGYLSDYQIVSMYTENKFIEGVVKKNKYVSTVELEVSESHYIACAILLLNAIQAGKAHHLLTYHNSIDKSKKFKSILESLLVYYGCNKPIILHLDGDMSMNKRTKILNEFKESETCILTSARVLNEGVNIPIIDSVCFIDPRTSTIDIVQCIGRSLRLHEKKTISRVFVPLIIEDINNVDEKKVFGNVIKIIKSMYSTDSGIIEYFAAKKHGQKVDRELIEYDTTCMISEKVGDNIDITDWINGIEMRIWQNVDSFEYSYNQLKKFLEGSGKDKKNKKIYPSAGSNKQADRSLSQWCSDRRQEYAKGKLDDYKTRKLSALDDWSWGKLTFDEMYEKVKKWMIENEKHPSSTSKDIIEYSVGIWCNNQRGKKQNERRGKLSDDQISKLQLLPGWYWFANEPKKIKTFDQRYEESEQWKKTHTKLPSKHSKNKVEKSLAHWIEYIKKREDNDPERQKLKSLLEWDDSEKPSPKTLDERCEELQTWINDHNKTPSQSAIDPIESSLANWYARIKCKKKSKNISDSDREKVMNITINKSLETDNDNIDIDNIELIDELNNNSIQISKNEISKKLINTENKIKNNTKNKNNNNNNNKNNNNDYIVVKPKSKKIEKPDIFD